MISLYDVVSGTINECGGGWGGYGGCGGGYSSYSGCGGRSGGGCGGSYSGGYGCGGYGSDDDDDSYSQRKQRAGKKPTVSNVKKAAELLLKMAGADMSGVSVSVKAKDISSADADVYIYADSMDSAARLFSKLSRINYNKLVQSHGDERFMNTLSNGGNYYNIRFNVSFNYFVED